MKEKNNKEASIIPFSSTSVIRVGNSINVSKKIISQGHVLERDYSKIYAIPYKKSDGWYLYDKRTNTFCKGPYRLISRNREFTLCLDFKKIYWLLKNDQILCHFRDFTHDNSLFKPKIAAPFKIIENRYIVLYYYVAIYGRKYIEGLSLEIQGLLDFHGNKIEHTLTEKDISVIMDNENRDDLKIADTFWKISEAGLYFKNHLILNAKDSTEIKVSDFHYGYALVEVVAGYDSEFGELSSDIGYIDVYGNYYWG